MPPFVPPSAGETVLLWRSSEALRLARGGRGSMAARGGVCGEAARGGSVATGWQPVGTLRGTSKNEGSRWAHGQRTLVSRPGLCGGTRRQKAAAAGSSSRQQQYSSGGWRRPRTGGTVHMAVSNDYSCRLSTVDYLSCWVRASTAASDCISSGGIALNARSANGAGLRRIDG